MQRPWQLAAAQKAACGFSRNIFETPTCCCRRRKRDTGNRNLSAACRCKSVSCLEGFSRGSLREGTCPYPPLNTQHHRSETSSSSPKKTHPAVTPGQLVCFADSAAGLPNIIIMRRIVRSLENEGNKSRRAGLVSALGTRSCLTGCFCQSVRFSRARVSVSVLRTCCFQPL